MRRVYSETMGMNFLEKIIIIPSCLQLFCTPGFIKSIELFWSSLCFVPLVVYLQTSEPS